MTFKLKTKPQGTIRKKMLPKNCFRKGRINNIDFFPGIIAKPEKEVPLGKSKRVKNKIDTTPSLSRHSFRYYLPRDSQSPLVRQKLVALAHSCPHPPAHLPWLVVPLL